MALEFDPIAEAARQWDAHWGGEATTAMEAVTSIMRAQQILGARLNELLAPLDLTFARYEALTLLSYTTRGSLPLGKIGERLQVHRASVTNVVDRLEAQGLVRRVAHEEDRRTTLAEITPAGRRVATRATKALNAAGFATSPLDEGDLSELVRILRGLRLAAGDFRASPS